MYTLILADIAPKACFALGIIIAALMLAAALWATVRTYLVYCSKHPSHKRAFEIATVIVVVVLSLTVRAVVGGFTNPDLTFTGGIKSFFYSIFSSIAGLTFNSLLELGDTAVISGILACLYYGIIIYASLVFLSVITAGLSYEFYSRIQMRRLRRRFCSYYIFTAITQDTLLLAEDIKRRKTAENERARAEGRKVHRFAVIFFENGDESFTRKNPLHCRIMEQGFFYYSDFRRDDRGETVSILKIFKFRVKDCCKDDGGTDRNKLFYVFAMGDCGGFEGDNAELVFEDAESVLKSYVHCENGAVQNEIPTTVNYFLLTGGEINFETYKKRLNSLLDGYCKGLGASDGDAAVKDLQTKIQINIFNEATLSSQDLIKRRYARLEGYGASAFEEASRPDGNGAYRIAVIGFGKTGQYAMEELYTHTAHLQGNKPVRFIADVYDTQIDSVSGLFAYNHPLFKCIDGKGAPLSTHEILQRADKAEGEAYSLLYSGCEKIMKLSPDKAKKLVEEQMGLPVAVFHSDSCFKFPFMCSPTADVGLKETVDNEVRAYVLALGDDERNIAMANMLIDAFKRSIVSGKFKRGVTVYVNLIEERSAGRLNWNAADEAMCNGGGEGLPKLSVVPFGCRNRMFSYSTLIDDYAARLYNYGYWLLTEDGDGEHSKKFFNELSEDYNSYRASDAVSDMWLKVTPFLRLSNKSAQLFAVNYFKMHAIKGGFDEEDWELAVRLEHERWNRFYIAHGWEYADYPSGQKFARRDMKQHTCLCPFDGMLDEYTKKFDRANVALGLIEGIVYGDERRNSQQDGVKE